MAEYIITVTATENVTLTPWFAFTSGGITCRVDDLYFGFILSGVEGSVPVTAGQKVEYICTNGDALLQINLIGDKVSGNISGWTLPSNLTRFYVTGTLLSGDISGWTLPSDLSHLYIDSTDIDYDSAAGAFEGITNVFRKLDFDNCALTASQVDNVLLDLVTSGITNSVTPKAVDVGDNNAAPSAAGLASKEILETRGWTVKVTAGESILTPIIPSLANYKKDELIEFGYQVPNTETGLLNVTAEIYPPNKTKDIVNFPDIILVEVADTGTYRGSFTPNAVGVWQVILHKDGASSKDGQVNKTYSVGNYNLHEIGLAVDNLQYTIAALGDVATDGDMVVARDAIILAISALHNIDSAEVQAAIEAAIVAINIATATNVSDAQSALEVLIALLSTNVDIQDIAATTISDADLVTASFVTVVKNVVDNIALSVASLDTPPQAF